MNYTVKRCPGAVGALSFKSVFDAKALPAPWNEADEAEILDYCWINEFPDHFYCAARVCADDSDSEPLSSIKSTKAIISPFLVRKDLTLLIRPKPLSDRHGNSCRLD